MNNILENFLNELKQIIEELKKEQEVKKMKEEYEKAKERLEQLKKEKNAEKENENLRCFFYDHSIYFIEEMGFSQIKCRECDYHSPIYLKKDECIEEHNNFYRNKRR